MYRTKIPATIRFRRWSRRAYSAFCSVGRCVTIGVLGRDVADASLCKGKVTIALGAAAAFEPTAELRESDLPSDWGAAAAVEVAAVHIRSVASEPCAAECGFLRGCAPSY